MKKLLLASAILLSLAGKAQVGMDTLLFNNFETDPSNYLQLSVPIGFLNDTSWYDFDLDGLPDGSGAGRPLEWFWSSAFSDADTVGNTGVIASSSWTNGSVPTENILITPAVYIGDTSAMLHWKSAPYQTPRYLDGYQVLISTGTNDLSQFTDTIFVASEYTSLDVPLAPNSFASYTFTPGPSANPMDPFVHGMDSTYTEFNPTSDSSRLTGLLRPFQFDLTPYAGQTIYIMFRHYCVDDNLIEVDDIMVTGTDFTHVPELTPVVKINAYPNPAADAVNLKYDLSASTEVVFNLYDMNGRLVSSHTEGQLPEGVHTAKLDISALPQGVYQLQLVTAYGTGNQRIIKN